jgi:A/G-specific adenine glycosylase
MLPASLYNRTMSSEAFPPAQLRQFRQKLLTWFDGNARDLPWRRTNDPYAIWVSEIMLQQTRVNAVLDHYARFMRRFPTVQKLAEAQEPEVLAVWSGLGYYRRARMLHKAAQFVVSDLSGKMPRTAEGLRELAGIGEYTSAAIGSIAFGDPVAAVDGNVERVITRWASLADQCAEEGRIKAGSFHRTIREITGQLLDRQRPGDFNQAMMELGATLCLPKNPLCLQCPVQKLCRTRGEHPTPQRKEMRTRQVSYALLRRSSRRDGVEILLEQRSPEASLMAGMWELPEVEGSGNERLLLSVRHAITSTNYLVSILHFEPEEKGLLPRRKVVRNWVRAGQLHELPLTGLARKVLKRTRIFPDHVPSDAASQTELDADTLPLL